MTRCLLCRALLHRGSYCIGCRPQGPSRGWRWSTEIVPAVLARDGHRCTQCQRACPGADPNEPTRPHTGHHDVDHRKPLAMGGTDEMSNLRTRCAKANRGNGLCA